MNVGMESQRLSPWFVLPSYLLASFYTKYDAAHFLINTASLLSVLLPKLPQFHGVRLFGINKYWKMSWQFCRHRGKALEQRDIMAFPSQCSSVSWKSGRQDKPFWTPRRKKLETGVPEPSLNRVKIVWIRKGGWGEGPHHSPLYTWAACLMILFPCLPNLPPSSSVLLYIFLKIKSFQLWLKFGKPEE